jgi:transcriptional regulator of acetoin/glycerol metabolism
MGYSWPGNVRELRNAIEQAFVLGEGETLTLADLPPELQYPNEAPPGVVRQEATDLHDLERAALVEAWKLTGGRRQVMAETLGISRSTLYRRLRAHGLA